MASQLELQLALNRALTARNELLSEQSKLVKSQLADVIGLKQAWTEVEPKQEDILATIKSMHEALGDTTERFEELQISGQVSAIKIAEKILKSKDATTGLKIATEKLTKQYGPASAAVAGFADGLISGFKLVKHTLSATIGLVGAMTKGIKDTSLSIAAIPFRSLSALIAISNKLVPLMEAIARATEEVRKQFGDINSGSGRDIIETAKNIGTGFENIGLGGYRVFGSLDERLQAVNKLATAMGATFELFSDEILKGNGAVMLLQKGLGLTDENMKALAKRAKAVGSPISSQLKEMTKFSVDFGKKFGVSQKLISRDMGLMVGDVKHFGNMAPKELARVSVYARKLGLDVQDLLGVVDKFDTFESAAESAAMLSQAFGANVDAIKLMKSENPAERIEELRRAFLSTGKSADMLSRQELKLLAQTTGLSEETARVALSQKNAGISMQELEKQGKITEQRQLTTAEAVAEVQKSIERVIKPFKQFAGFLQALADGFARGIFNARDFRDLMVKLHGALHRTYQVGIEMGQAFMDFFPGIKGITEGLRNMLKVGDGFAPFGKFITGVRDSFMKFFKTIKDGPGAVSRLFVELKSSFSEFLSSFDVKGAEGNGKQLFSAIGNIVAGLIREFSNGAVQIFQIITSIITGEGMPKNIPGGGIARSLLDPIIKEFNNDNGPIKKLWPAFKTMLEKIWDKHGDDIKGALTPLAIGAASVIFGSAFIKAATSALVFSVSQAALSGLATWVSGGGISSASGILAGAGETLATALASPFVIIPALIGGVLATAIGTNRGMKKFRDDLSKEFGKTDSMVGASIAGIADTISFGLIPDSVIKMIGKQAASLSKSLFDGITSLPFGKEIARMFRETVREGIEIFGSLGELISAVMNGSSADVQTAASNFGDRLVSFIGDQLKLFVYKLPALTIGITTQLGIWLMKGLAIVITKLIPWLLKMTSTALQVVSGVIASFAYKIGDALGQIPIIGSMLKDITKGVGDLFSALGTFFGWLSDKFNETLKAANVLMNMSFGDIIKSLTGWVSGAWDTFVDVGVSVVKGIISGITSMGGALADGLKKGFDKAFSSVKSTFSDAASSGIQAFKDVWGIHSPSTEAMAMGTNISKSLSDSLSIMPSNMEMIADKSLKAISDALSSSSVIKGVKNFTSPAVAVITSMIDEANTINDSLANLDIVNLDIKLKALADKLGIDNEKFRVKQGQLNITLNVNVTMEADKLAKVLSEHGIVSTEKPTR